MTVEFSVVGIVIDIIASWSRMIIALVISILFSLTIGITAARNKRAESVIIPLLDVFQSIPVLGFFPLVILGLIAVLPGFLGENLAVIILIFTSMSWNIAFGVYEVCQVYSARLHRSIADVRERNVETDYEHIRSGISEQDRL